MKNILSITLLLLLVGFQSVSFSQTAAEKDEMTATLTKIFDISKTKDIAGAAGLLAYSGENEADYLKKALVFSNADDLSSAKRLLRKVKSLIDISDSYTFDAAGTTTKKDLTIYTLNVKFKSGAQVLTSVFSFSKINNKLMLAYVD